MAHKKIYLTELDAAIFNTIVDRQQKLGMTLIDIANLSMLPLQRLRYIMCGIDVATINDLCRISKALSLNLSIEFEPWEEEKRASIISDDPEREMIFGDLIDNDFHF